MVKQGKTVTYRVWVKARLIASVEQIKRIIKCGQTKEIEKKKKQAVRKSVIPQVCRSVEGKCIL